MNAQLTCCCPKGPGFGEQQQACDALCPQLVVVTGLPGRQLGSSIDELLPCWELGAEYTAATADTSSSALLTATPRLERPTVPVWFTAPPRQQLW